MKKKLLVVMMNLYNGGAEKSLINLFNELDYSRYDVDLLLFQKKGLFLKQVPINVNIIEQPKNLYFLYNKPNLKDLFSIKNIKLIISRFIYTILVNVKYKKLNSRARRQLRWDKYYKKLLKCKEGQYDIALSYLENEPMRYVIDKVNAKKKLVWFHNDYKRLGLLKELDEIYYKKADKIITISEECLKVLNEVFPKMKDKTIYIPNISSGKVIKSLAAQKPAICFDNNKFKIVSIGRLSYEKGFDIALEAAKILKDKNIEYQWFIIGNGIMKKQLCRKIKEYKLEKYFCLIGITDNPYSYINSADILVQPSRSEGKSMVLDEAKILNKPFVVTKYPTVFDQANDEISVLVEINPNAIADGIIELYNDRKRIDKMKNNLKKNTYSNENEIEKYYKLFDE